MAFTDFKWFKHLIALSKKFQRNKKVCIEENIRLLLFHFQLFHLFCRVQFTGCGAWCVGCWARGRGMRVSLRSITGADT